MSNDLSYILRLFGQKPLPIQALIGEIKTWPCQTTALFYCNNPTVQPFFDSAAMKKLWRRYRENIVITGIPGFQLQAQTQLSDQQLVVGYQLHTLALCARRANFQDNYNFYLRKAFEQHSIYAYQTRLSEDISLPGSYSKKIKKMLEELERWHALVLYQRTPAALMLASAYYYLSLLARNEKDGARLLSFLKSTWHYFILAELMESSSAAEIHNAYFGQGLVLSNPYRLASIKACQQHVLQSFPSLISAQLQKSVGHDVREWLKEHHLKNNSFALANIQRKNIHK